MFEILVGFVLHSLLLELDDICFIYYIVTVLRFILKWAIAAVMV